MFLAQIIALVSLGKRHRFTLLELVAAEAVNPE